MKYFKLLKNNEFLNIATSHDLRKFQLKHKILLSCDINSAQYIQIGDLLYHDNWLCPVTTDNIQYAEAKIISIEKEEYDLLLESVKAGEEVILPPALDEDVEEDMAEEVDPIKEVTLDFIKEQKIKEMSKACNLTIEKGVDVTLSDDQSHHFSLTAQDQLNLISLQTMIISGQTSIPYHADNEPCRFFSSDELKIVLTAAMNYITYHESYFNSLKTYINSFEDVESISKIEYGVEIPEEYQTDVLRQLIASKE